MKPIKRSSKHKIHPGEILLNLVLKPNSLSTKKASKILLISNNKLKKILCGKRKINNSIAIRISEVFGGSSKLWLRLQYRFDLEKSKKKT
ncbi:MAG: HigA family addiction module antitoxin [Chryseobacterium sp.]